MGDGEQRGSSSSRALAERVYERLTHYGAVLLGNRTEEIEAIAHRLSHSPRMRGLAEELLQLPFNPVTVKGNEPWRSSATLAQRKALDIERQLREGLAFHNIDVAATPTGARLSPMVRRRLAVGSYIIRPKAHLKIFPVVMSKLLRFKSH